MFNRGRLLPYVIDVAQRVMSGSQTVGAAIAVFDEDGRMLMVRSRHAAGWSLPAGYRRRGEEIEDTATRELLEETGVRAQPEISLVAVVFETEPAHVTALFRGQFQSKSVLRPGLLRRFEISDCGWFTAEEVQTLVLRSGTAELLDRLADSHQPAQPVA